MATHRDVSQQPPAAQPYPVVNASDQQPTLEPQHAYPVSANSPDGQGEPAPVREISAEERQWATDIVAAHLQQQAGAPVPADLNIRPTRNGYRIFVQYLQFDEQGQPFHYPGGHCSIWLSREGQVREVTCGHWQNQRR